MKKKMEVQDYKSKTLWKFKIVKIQDFANKKIMEVQNGERKNICKWLNCEIGKL